MTRAYSTVSAELELAARRRHLPAGDPVAGDRGPAQCDDRRPAGRPRGEPLGDEPGVEGVAGAGRVCGGDGPGRDVEPDRGAGRRRTGPRRPGISSRTSTVAPASPRLTTTTGARARARASVRPPAPSRPGASTAVANRRSGATPRDELERSLAGRRRGAARRRQVEADERAGRPGEIDGRAGRRGRAARRAASRPAGGAGVASCEPGRRGGRRLEPVGRAPVGDERPLAARRDEDADPPGRHAAGDPDDPRRHAVGPDRLDERPTGGVPPDRRDELASTRRAGPASGRCSPPSHPGGRDPAGHVGAAARAAGPARARRRARGRRARRSAERRRRRRRPGARRCGRDAGRCGCGGWTVGNPAEGRHGTSIAAAATMQPSPRPSPRAREPETTDDHRHRPLDRLAIDTIRTLVDRRRPEGELRSPGRPDGRGADGLRPVDALPAPRPDPARTGPTATGSSCRPATPRCSSTALLHLTGYDLPLDDLEALPPVGLADARPPRVRPDARASRRRPGRSARASPTPSGWRSRSAASRPSSTARATRSSTTGRYVIVLRRRPPGGHRVGGRVAGRPPPARQARSSSTTTTTSSSTGRRRWPGQRGRPGALRRVRLAHPAGRRRQRPRGDRGARSTTRPADERPSLIAVRTHIGYGSAEQAGQPEGPRLAARPGRGPPHQGGLRLGPGPDVLRPGRGGRDVLARRSPRGESSWPRTGRRASGALPRRVPGRGRASSSGGSPATCAAGWDAGLHDATRSASEVATRNASQDAIQALAGAVPELFGGAADLSESNLTDVKGAADFTRRRGRPEPPLRRPRARDGRDRQRDRLPRRVHPVRRHVPHLQRLHARLGPARGAVRPPRHLRLDPRLGRARRGRPDPPAGRALRRAPGDPEPVVRPTRRRERDGRRLGASRSSGATARSPSR